MECPKRHFFRSSPTFFARSAARTTEMVVKITTSVIRIVQNNCPPSLTPASPKVSVNKLQIAVFQARTATRPRAVVINYENVSSASPVNDISFQPLAAL